MGKGKNINPTKGSEFVSYNHFCTECGKGKDDVNFRVSNRISGNYVDTMCNGCRGKRQKPRKKAKVDALTLRDRFKSYFQSKVYA